MYIAGTGYCHWCNYMKPLRRVFEYGMKGTSFESVPLGICDDCDEREEYEAKKSENIRLMGA